VGGGATTTFGPTPLSRSDPVPRFVRSRQRFVRWSQASGVSHKCAEHAHAYKKASSGQERIPAFPFVSPPEQHGCSGVNPETSPDEFALTQIDDRPEPRPYSEAKGEPVEQNYGYEYRCNEWHFLFIGSLAAAPRSRLITERFLCAKSSTL
jgi:hypothetical protein